LTLVRLCALPLTVAALPPEAIDDPVPEAPTEVPPVPSVEAEVPPAAADPPVPPVMLVCAEAGRARRSDPEIAAARRYRMFGLLNLVGADGAAIDGERSR